MENELKLKKLFAEAFGVDESIIVDELTYKSIEQWDSLAHMILITLIEEAFNIMIETEDVIDMSSFLKAKEILKKYKVEF
ncbi:MAG: acyl carrier protein [Clostridia bacterium]